MIEYLDRKHSQDILNLGIHPDYASLVSWKSTQAWDSTPIFDKEHIEIKPFRPAVMGNESFDCQDVFAISDLINILPATVSDFLGEYTLNMKTDNKGGWVVSYIAESGREIYICNNQKLIMALYEMCIHYLKTGKI